MSEPTKAELLAWLDEVEGIVFTRRGMWTTGEGLPEDSVKFAALRALIERSEKVEKLFEAVNRVLDRCRSEYPSINNGNLVVRQTDMILLADAISALHARAGSDAALAAYRAEGKE